MALLVAALVAVAVTLTGLAYLSQGDAVPPSPYDEFALSDAQAVNAPALPADRVVGIPLADSATTATIDRLEAQTSSVSSPGQLSLLARLLLQRAAVTGDAETYARASRALDEAVDAAPEDMALRAQRATTRITTHDFVGAARDAAVVLAANPDDAAGLGAAYDAAVETGDYARASSALGTPHGACPRRRTGALPERPLVRSPWRSCDGREPGSASPRCGSELRVLSALAAPRTTLSSASSPSTRAATPRRCSPTRPLSRPLPAGTPPSPASVERAPHPVIESVRKRPWRWPLTPCPCPTLSAASAISEPCSGTMRGQLSPTALSTSSASCPASNAPTRGPSSCRTPTVELAPRRPSAAARAELVTRHDVYGDDALAWALLADGRAKQAVRHADASLALGTADPRLLAHAGLVHAAVGHRARATELLTAALEMSPMFDPILAPRAQATLAQLTSGNQS